MPRPTRRSAHGQPRLTRATPPTPPPVTPLRPARPDDLNTANLTISRTTIVLKLCGKGGEVALAQFTPQQCIGLAARLLACAETALKDEAMRAPLAR